MSGATTARSAHYRLVTVTGRAAAGAAELRSPQHVAKTNAVTTTLPPASP